MTDLDIIKKLEQEIGEELRQISLEDIMSWSGKNGYAVDENKHVIRLNLGESRLSTIPNALTDLSNLKKLFLRSNKIIELPASFGQLRNLSELNLSYNQLKELPASFGQLQNLSQLWLQENQLKELPASFGQLRNLSKLYLYENQLEELPASFGQLQNLSKLWLQENQLKELPASFGQLRNLSELNLSYNQLKELPASFGQLRNLSELWLKENQLKELPASFGQLQNLSQLDLDHNPLENPPPEIIKKGIKAILNYLKENEKQPLNEAKVLILGQGGVGKTSLIKRLVHSEFDAQEDKTHGINIQNWSVEINNETIRLNVWDFGGQEIMHATHQFFLTKRSLYLLVLDARQEEQYSRVEYWLKLIQTYGADSPVIVVTNKIDQQPLELNEKELSQKYRNIKSFHQVSCKNAENIEILKQEIFTRIDQLKHVHDLLPTSWFNVKTKLEKMRRDFIPYEEYVKICKKQKIDTSSQNTLIGFLHDLGIVLNFNDDKQRPYLKETNILNPQWITQGIYTILNSNQLFQSKGVLDLEQLAEILPDHEKYLEGKHRFIVDIMEKFELCFEFPDVKNRILIPDLLSKQEPDINWDYENSLRFELHYDVLPSSVISRFIVHLHKLASKNTYWRTGIVLAKDKAKALVKADIEDRFIYIYVTGEQKRELLQTIRVTFEKIRSTIAKLVVKEQVPYENVLIPYQHLVAAEEMGEEQYTVYELRKRVNVKKLLNGIERTRNKNIGQTFNFQGDLVMGDKNNREFYNKGDIEKTNINLGDDSELVNNPPSKDKPKINLRSIISYLFKGL